MTEPKTYEEFKKQCKRQAKESEEWENSKDGILYDLGYFPHCVSEDSIRLIVEVLHKLPKNVRKKVLDGHVTFIILEKFLHGEKIDYYCGPHEKPKKTTWLFLNFINKMSESHRMTTIAHEIAHVKNRDILISTIAGTIAGVISYIATMAQWAAIFGGLGGRNRDNNSNIISLLLLAIITPIIATLIQLAISRSREYIADAGGAKILKDSSGLASALEKIESSVKNHPLIATPKADATAHMFIVNPFRSGAFIRMFMTHPQTNLRIKKLKEMRF